MTKRIGGFFEIEIIDPALDLFGDSILKYWTSEKNFALFSTARSIVLNLREELNSSTVWIPEIYCDVFDGIDGIKHYLLAKNSFDPDIQFLSDNIKPNDIVIVVDYFGTEAGKEFIEFVREETSVNWVEDAAHNLRPLNNWADFTLFSPRKLVGVADGGILVQNRIKKEQINFSNWILDFSASKLAMAPFLRLITPDYLELFNTYRFEESNLDSSLRSMSDYTQWQLSHMSISEKVSRRRDNFSILKEEFGELLPSGLVFTTDTVPFGFPVYIKNRDDVQKKLAEHHVFAPIHWSNRGKSKTDRQAIHEGSTLTIPCDHRYSAEDMDYIKRNLKSSLL